MWMLWLDLPRSSVQSQGSNHSPVEMDPLIFPPHQTSITQRWLQKDIAGNIKIYRGGGDRYMDLCFPGSFAIMGPKVMRGPERGSLTVRCRYGPGWKTHKKWWCRGADWTSCKILVITTGSEQEVEQDRVSIRDDQRNLTFTVTMEELRRDDADTYWCGIERTGTDLGFQVKVTIDPAPVTPEETRVSPTVTSHHSESSSVSLKLSVLIPLIFAVLLLLSVAASLLAWRMVKQREKAPEISQEQALQPLESDVCYANLTLQHTGTSSGPSRKKASRKPSYSAQVDQVEGEYVTMDSFLREDISYPARSLDTLDQEPTYSNTSHLVAHIPSGSHGEPTEYSTIRKP
ncbi:CMRF35-like molecule 1 [Equus asinus]|uniref:CMRF35-like molecule 1 n=1 Tax=Equus asinus TaxID=9793 RepID=UPI0038F67B73